MPHGLAKGKAVRAKTFFWLHQQIAYAPAPEKLSGTRQDTTMRVRKANMKKRRLNGSRKTGYDLSDVHMAGSDTRGWTQQRTPSRPVGVQNVSNTLSSLRPELALGICTASDKG